MSDDMTPDTAGSGAPMSVDDAVSKYLGLLNAPQEGQASEREDDDAPEPSDADDAATSERDDPEDGDQSQDDEEPEQQTPEPRKVTVKVDGKTMEVDEAELVAGYQRQADYTRKTQEAAEMRRQAEADRQAAASERDRYAASLQQVEAYLAQQVETEPDWAAEFDRDPIEAGKRYALWQQRERQLANVRGERQRIEAQQRTEHEAALRRMIAEEDAKLRAAVPDWADDAKAQAGKQAVAKFLVDAGFSKEEVSNVVDHRIVVVVRDAMRYREMMAAKPKVERKVADAPKTVQPGPAQTGKGRNADQVRQLEGKLKTTGLSVENAARLLQLRSGRGR